MQQPQVRMYSGKQRMDVKCDALVLSAVKLHGRIEAKVLEELKAEET